MNEYPPRARSSRVAAVAGALLGGTGVALAAVAAHAGSVIGDPTRVAMLRAGVEMQIWHALALLAAASLCRAGGHLATLAIGGLLAGTLMFAVGVDGPALGLLPATPLAPIGGTVLIASWFVLAAAVYRAR